MIVSQGLTINGPGRDHLTIDAQQNSRIFNFPGGTGDFTISGLTLTNGRSTLNSPQGSGGAIFSMTSDMTTITGCRIHGNSTTGNGRIWRSYLVRTD